MGCIICIIFRPNNPTGPWKHPALSFSPVQVPSSIGVVLGLTTIEPSRLGRKRMANSWLAASWWLQNCWFLGSNQCSPTLPSNHFLSAKATSSEVKDAYAAFARAATLVTVACYGNGMLCFLQCHKMSHPWVLHPLWQLLFGFEWHTKSLQLLQGTAEQASFLRDEAKSKNGQPRISLGIGRMFKIMAHHGTLACWSRQASTSPFSSTHSVRNSIASWQFCRIGLVIAWGGSCFRQLVSWHAGIGDVRSLEFCAWNQELQL